MGILQPFDSSFICILYKKINPDQWETIPELVNFYADLPKNPYCTNEKGTCYPRHKKSAIKRKYIQPNHPQLVKWLVFDIDTLNAIFAYHDNNLPRPQLVGRNRENGHAHYLYKLTIPVALYGKAHLKPIEYMRAVYGALANELGADPSYGGNLIKCPFSNSHDWYITGAEPSYTLEQLAEYLDLAPPNMPIITHRRIMTTTLGVTVQLSTIHGTEHTKSLINSMNNNYSSRFWQSLKNLTQTLINRCYPMKPIISQGQSHAFVSRHDGASTIKRLLRNNAKQGEKVIAHRVARQGQLVMTTNAPKPKIYELQA